MTPEERERLKLVLSVTSTGQGGVWVDGDRARGHWDDCWKHHDECALQRISDLLDVVE